MITAKDTLFGLQLHPAHVYEVQMRSDTQQQELVLSGRVSLRHGRQARDQVGDPGLDRRSVPTLRIVEHVLITLLRLYFGRRDGIGWMMLDAMRYRIDAMVVVFVLLAGLDRVRHAARTGCDEVAMLCKRKQPRKSAGCADMPMSSSLAAFSS